MRFSLSAHPNLVSANTENNIVGDLLLTCDRNAKYESRRIAMQVSEDDYELLFARFVLDLVFPDVKMHDEHRLMFSTWLTPESAECAMKLFPGSKIVLIVRDGIATIESRLAHHTLKQGAFEAQCEEWASWNLLYEWMLNRDDCLIIRHEHLVAGPASTIASVIEFLGLVEHPAPAAVLENRQFHPTPASERPRWQQWSDADRQAFERLCAPAMGALGYPIPWLEMDQPAHACSVSQ